MKIQNAIIEKLSKEEEIALVEKYHQAVVAGDKKGVTEVMEIVWMYLERFVIKSLTESFSTYYYKFPEEMKHEAYIWIHKEFPKFDPEKSALLTWARLHIKHAGQEYIDNEFARTSAHYARSINKITNEINKASKKGIILTDTDLHEITGIAYTTILKCKDIMNSSNVIHIESNDFNSDTFIKSKERSPEEKLIEEEEQREIDESIRMLMDIEQAIIKLKYGFDGRACSNRDIADQLGMPIDKVARALYSAESKLKKRLKNSQVFSNRIVVSTKTTCNEIVFLPKADVSYLSNTLKSFQDLDMDF